MLLLEKLRIRRLVARGDRERLAVVLSHGNADIRFAAAQALSDMGDVRGVEALGRSQDPRAAGLLLTYMNDRARYDCIPFWPRTVHGAVVSLGEPMIQPLLDVLSSESAHESTRYHAAACLRDIGAPAAVEPVLRFLERRPVYLWGTDEFPFRDYLAAVGGAAVAPLVDRLQSPDHTLRKFAADTLARIKDQRALGPLLRLLHDANDEVRKAAVRALACVGGPLAVEAMIAALDDFPIRGEVAEALGQLGDPRAVPPLIERLTDDHPAYRGTVARALGMLADPRAVDPLVAALTSITTTYAGDVLPELNRELISRELVSALGAIGDARALPVLAGAMHVGRPSREDPYRPSLTSEVIARFGPAAVGELSRLLQDHDVLTRLDAVSALAAIEDPSATHALSSALRDGSELGYDRPRELARRALVQRKTPLVAELMCDLIRTNSDEYKEAEEVLFQCDPPRAVDLLLSRLADGDERVRFAAAQSLSHRGWLPLNDADRSLFTRAVVPLLKSKNSSERSTASGLLKRITWVPPDEESRATFLFAAQKWGQLQKGGDAALSVLIDALDDDDKEVRRIAKDTLKRITGQGFGADRAAWQQWFESQKTYDVGGGGDGS